MIIANNTYNVSETVSNISYIRQILHTTIYNNLELINKLFNIISKHIECLSEEYIPETRVFVLKIKKTSMKKQDVTAHTAIFYYDIIRAIFNEFFMENANDIYNELIATLGPNKGNYTYQFIYNIVKANPENLNMLCNIVCMGTNYMEITL